MTAISVSLGLKYGGALEQLAVRAFFTVGKEREEWNPYIHAKPVKIDTASSLALCSE